MPKQRKKKSTISNYDFVCVLLYIIENGCKRRTLPKEFGNWHTVYVRFNRWSNAEYALAFHLSPGNNHDAPEGRILIGNIVSHDNYTLLMLWGCCLRVF